MKIAVIGATGLVGNVMMKVLEERNFPITELYLVASQKSVGKSVSFKNKEYKIKSIEEVINLKPDFAIFSAGSEVSKLYAPLFAEKGTVVIDNSSYWRMDNNIKLVVPEVNGDTLTNQDKIIANPNCSTIQMVVALAPLHKAYKIKRLVISTYQSVTGTGVKAVTQLENERKGVKGEMAYSYPIDMNCFPHGGSFVENGNTTEEEKLIHETRKILNDYNIQVSATVVRIPTTGGHSESVNIEFEKPFQIEELKQLLSVAPGIIVQDDVTNNIYPMPLWAKDKDEVFVGRIRRDESIANGLNLWIVADNLRKGAATNAIQIAERLMKK